MSVLLASWKDRGQDVLEAAVTALQEFCVYLYDYLGAYWKEIYKKTGAHLTMNEEVQTKVFELWKNIAVHESGLKKNDRKRAEEGIVRRPPLLRSAWI